MPIRKLPPLLVNQIAAGEVIERPVSVVKELIDNCLDAGATRVDVAVEDGGRQLIRISDDGSGIAAEELPLAVAPHATSKLADADALAAIRTMGFRGEALASIASVSRLRLTSRPRDGESGAAIEAAGDHVSDVQWCAASPGTVVEVRDLFFNVPARRKFLRGGPIEFGHISEVVQRVAMVHCNVAFSLSHNGRPVFELAATASRRQRNVEVLGRELDEALLTVELEEPPMRGRARVWGLAGLPSIARATAKFQYVCVNGRPIRDRGIAHAMKEAYRGLIPPDKQPVVVVLIDIEPEAVDVNVHPTKAAVRFRDPGRVHSLVLTALRQRLLGADLTPSAGIADQATGFGRFSLPPADRAALDDRSPDPSAFVDYFRRMAPQQKGFVYEEVKRALAEESPDLIADAAPDPSAAPADAPSLRPTHILQVHKSYVVTEDEQGIVIIDQHALHERVMFETLRDRVMGDGRPLESQRLLMPAIVHANTARLAALDAVTPLLARLGIEAQPIGPQQIAVHAFPSFLFDRKVDPISFMEELLDRVSEDDSPLADGGEEAALHEVLDMMACKAAVKAGDALTDAELAALLQRRHDVERSGSCPHGRPTTIRLTLRDLEKHFKRT
jgi:DNA mismatch repair protein MutL